MFATQVLPETCFEDKRKDETILESVGFIVVENKEYEVRKGENKIGRDPSICSIVLENFTVSKLHAIIESDGVDETFIYDVGSTNQTKLGKKNLKPHYRYKIDNGTLITLGNVVAKFVEPSAIEDDSKSTKMSTPNSGGNSSQSDVLNELGDIFDVSTQIDAPQPSTSKVVTKFERVPDDFHVFKVPSSVVYNKETKDSPGITESCFEATTQSQLSPTGFPKPFLGIEDSDIFSLTTQCQLPQHLPSIESNEKSGNEESDAEKLKSLLNDGEDDVLCCFMAVNSPDGNFMQKEPIIKTEVTETNSDAIFDVPTQMPFESEPKESTDKSREIKQEVLAKESFGEDFHCTIKQEFSQNPDLCSDKNCVIEKAAGQINSQEGKNARSQENADKDSKPEEENFSQNSTESYLEISIEDIEVRNEEDLILTQKFECLEKNEELRVKKEDLDETQVYDVKNVRCPEIFEVPKIPSMVMVESSDDDTESDLEILLQSSTQRIKNEDFIGTQLFSSRPYKNEEENDKEATKATQSFPITEPVEEDEDFIATQTREEPKQHEINNHNSRESSPDLLSDCPQRYTEDFTCTQAFRIEETKPEIKTETLESILFRRFGVPEESDCELVKGNDQNQVLPSTIPNSGDETESDLEIILSDTDFEPPKKKSLLGVNVKKESRDEVLEEDDRLIGDGDSNSSYVFQLEETQVGTTKEVIDVTDSDATDCEEICAINVTTSLLQCKKESSELQIESPDNCAEKSGTSNDGRLLGEESPKFEIGAFNLSEEESNDSWGSLSLKMPSTQEVETTLQKTLKRENEDPGKEAEDRPKPLSKTQKTEVRIKSSICLEDRTADFVNGTKAVDSPSKRIRSEDNFVEVVPTKKSRNVQNEETSDCGIERRLSRLCQAHDMSHIQTTRTRSSTKNLDSEKKGNSPECNFNNKRPPFRRKSPSRNGGRAKQAKSEAASRKSEDRKSPRVNREKDVPSMEDFLIKPESPEIKSVSRILRSARRKSGNLEPCNLFNSSHSSNSVRNGLRRSSRTKNEKPYFGSSCVNVVFTGFECEYLEKIIYDLGGKKRHDLSCGQVVVTDKVRRTVKFLCAVGLGLPVASPKWLLSCREENKFLNPWNYILKDEESEEKWDFDLKSSLERSKKTKLLRGFSVYATESTKPPVRDLLSIVECCGGIPLFERPEIWPKKTVIVSCVEDKDSWPPPKLRHVKIVHYEFILSGALTQRIDFRTYTLR